MVHRRLERDKPGAQSAGAANGCLSFRPFHKRATVSRWKIDVGCMEKSGSQEGHNQVASRSIKAVLFFDLANSSLLMSEREGQTLDYLESCFGIFRQSCENYDGSFVKSTGDGALLVFSSASAAVSCAIAVQNEIGNVESELGALGAFRAGIHVGEILQRDGDVFGNAVNIAARLEGLAEPGGICVSEEARLMAGGDMAFGFKSMGERRLRNIEQRLHVYHVIREAAKDPTPAGAHLNIRTIGGLQLLDGDTSILLPRNAKSRALVGYLAVSSPGQHLIGTICALLWPEHKPTDVRRAVTRMKKAMPALVAWSRDTEALSLIEGNVSVDLRDWEARLRIGKVERERLGVANWPEQILAGLSGLGSLFGSWLKVARNDWQARISTALENCLERLDLTDDNLRVVANALLQLEPGHERAARALIRHHHAVDKPGAAHRVFNDFSQHLETHYGLKPKPETVAAVRQQKTVVNPIQRSGSTPIRIRVGGFSADGEKASELCEGFRSVLLMGLASFRGWSVVEVEQPDEAERIADYVLSGSYSTSTRQLSISLVEHVSNRMVWSEQFLLEGSRFEAAKSKTVGRIAATLEVYISTDRINAPKHDPSKAAIDAWLHGERLFSRWTPEDHDRAAEIFSRLIEEEPDFVPGHASLASILNVRHIVRPGLPRDAEASGRAYRHADRAAELDPLDARNQLAVAWSASLEGDFDKASIHMEMAARLNPNSPRTIVSCAMGFAFFGEHKKALDLLEHSLTCAPMMLEYQWCYAASVYLFSGFPDKALVASQRGRDKIVDNPGWQAAILVQLGQKERASQQFATLVQKVATNWHLNEPATPERVLDWFVHAYPLRRDDERAALSESLAPIASGLGDGWRPTNDLV